MGATAYTLKQLRLTDQGCVFYGNYQLFSRLIIVLLSFIPKYWALSIQFHNRLWKTRIHMNVQLITFHGVINFWNDNYWYYFLNHNQYFFVVKSCPDPGRPENGDRYYQDRYFRVGSTVRFSCQSGFQLSGSKERTCMENKEWNGTLTTCQDGSKWEISQSSLKWNREGQWLFALDLFIYFLLPVFSWLWVKTIACVLFFIHLA